MYKGYPVGYLLFWANGEASKTKLIGTAEKQHIPDLLIVDGQQRLTSLYAVLKGREVIRENFRREPIVISFKPLDEKFEIPDAASKRNAEYLQNISDLWRPDCDIFEFAENFINNLEQTRAVSPDEKRKIRKAINNVKNLEHYPFSALELSANISEEDVADIFVRINAQGQKLNESDFILTLMSVFWEKGRFDLENFCREARNPDPKGPSPFNYIIKPLPDKLLRAAVGLAFKRARLQYVYHILRGKDLETGIFSEERRIKQFEILQKSQEKVLDLTNWHEYLKCIKQAGYLKGDIITSDIAIVYVYILFLIGREELNIPLHELKRIIARWFFMALLTGRYTGSAESQMESDLSLLRGVRSKENFGQILDMQIIAQFTTDYWRITLPNSLATSSSRSPSKYAYYASLNILDACGLFSKMKVRDLLQEGLRSKKTPLEIHHLFPKAYLARLGITDIQQTNQIANFALVEWSDNIRISDDAPAEYLPKLEKTMSDSERKEQYFYHALPEDWTAMDYEEFLAKRRVMMADVIKTAFEKL